MADLTAEQKARRCEYQRRYRERHPDRVQYKYRKTAIDLYKERVWRREHKEEWKARNLTEKVRAAKRAYTKRNLHKHNAQNAVFRAVHRGQLFRPDHCPSCGLVCKPQAHHKDYSKPLEVMWLCQICHKAEHRKEAHP